MIVPVILLITSSPFIVFPVVIIHPAQVFFVKEKTVVISFPINKTLLAPVIISSIGERTHNESGRWRNNQRNIRTGIRIWRRKQRSV
jgi:hypothetical protein